MRILCARPYACRLLLSGAKNIQFATKSPTSLKQALPDKNMPTTEDAQQVELKFLSLYVIAGAQRESTPKDARKVSGLGIERFPGNSQTIRESDRIRAFGQILAVRNPLAPRRNLDPSTKIP